MSHPIRLRVNGTEHSAEVEPRTLLSDFLRHDLALHGTHVGCEQGVCGACTVQVDGEPARSCLMLAVQANGCDVFTVEGMAGPAGLHPIQRAFQDSHALQCGFCTPGFLVTLESYLREHTSPDETEIREAVAGNLCRCTGYQGIVEAVKRTAAEGETWR